MIKEFNNFFFKARSKMIWPKCLIIKWKLKATIMFDIVLSNLKCLDYYVRKYHEMISVVVTCLRPSLMDKFGFC